ncbi:sugar phosphate nucleotidyltransferase [Desulfobotulus sp. H1]|uniref:Sugar phosphate nucleotidyltransferase n=1 Tax=Desulfobotulus pelophilus TaxID=2823377 RepID=A0ABT3N6G0_9BACT|nr:sugar phosphate nucleotidyltransferase [Desulfobotulus pelophilus]MCW7753030.1 sugar phosphate nucleotidyltransferase [Desulfobotulus pelophilus]
MRAILLAAGRGTRLRPHTEILPKPLFPSGGIPIIDRLIHHLAEQGIQSILINTHHLAPLLESHLIRTPWPIPVFFRRERVLLDTGGSIANMRNFFTEQTMLVMNADIDTDFELAPFLNFHEQNQALASLALMPSADMAHVAVCTERVTGFRDDPVPENCQRMAFTGIQLLSPEALVFFTKDRTFSSIEAYRMMIRAGKAPHAFTLPPSTRWSDLGSPDRFTEAALQQLFRRLKQTPPSSQTSLSGDGSDRRWIRACWPDNESVIIADHGIQGLSRPSEAQAFAAMGRHLKASGIPVPQMLGWDLFAGLIVTEDLGDERLHDRILSSGTDAALPFYEKILCLFPAMKKALTGFIPEMGFTFPAYDKTLILKRECAYFQAAFLEDLLGLQPLPHGLDEAFSHLADQTLAFSCNGLIHRDLQSRNIMIRGEDIRLIDFQGAMQGPLQYDLAALLLDPYAGLSPIMRHHLLDKAVSLMAAEGVCPEFFRKGYGYAAICRNLQMLGAFSFLWKEKKKPFFKTFILPALQTLMEQKAFHDKTLLPIQKAAHAAMERIASLHQNF